MGVDIGTLHDSMVAAALPVVGVGYARTAAERGAHVPAVDPVLWLPAGTGFVRLDLTRDLSAEEQFEAAGIIEAWVEAL
jgi:hypothetical protein